MKLNKEQVRSRVRAIPQVQFEDQQMTSFGGAVVIQSLLKHLHLKERLELALRTVGTPAYGLATVVLLLVVHVMLGFRSLRDRDVYDGDPFLMRLLGLSRFPVVSTLSRTLAAATDKAVDSLRAVLRSLVLERLRRAGLRRITLDFDGSVLSTRRHAEGTAVGYNKKRKGERSYYPLFCTVSQLGMFFDVSHRSGNVHDSNGAEAFILQCIQEVRCALGSVVIEVRMDSAFFQENLLDTLTKLPGVQFSASVPFERFPELKGMVQDTIDWNRLDGTWSFREVSWKPKSWSGGHSLRFVLLRHRVWTQRKGPLSLQTHLFEPRDTQFEYKVVVANRTVGAAALVTFHNGRGSQEAVFGEAKSAAGLEYIPSRRLLANQLFLVVSMLAHNLGRELQWQIAPKPPRATPNRTPSVPLRSLESLQKQVFQRAGRLTRPNGTLVLTLSANAEAQNDISQFLSGLACDTDRAA